MERSRYLQVTLILIIQTAFVTAQLYSSRIPSGKYSTYKNRLDSPKISDMNLMPVMTNLSVKCSRSGLAVFVDFSAPYSGIIYSKGHYRSEGCRYVTKGNNGKASYSFVIPTDDCGTINQLENRPGKEMFAANTIIIQNDPLIQEIWDQAKTLRCVWRTSFTKSINFNGFKVASPLTATIQLTKELFESQVPVVVGQMPSGKPIQGYLTTGSTPSLNILFEDSTANYDVDVGHCIGEDSGKNIEMTTKSGCNLVPDLWDQFRKISDKSGKIILFSYLRGLALRPTLKITCKITVCQVKCVSLCDDPPSVPSPLR